MVKLTLQNEFGKYTIELETHCTTLHDVMENGIKPLLIASGFSPDSVAEYLE